MDKKYEKIINLPRPVSERHPRMPNIQRAAQFAPFAALTGLDGMLAETARQTEREVFPDEGEIAAINDSLCWLRDNLDKNPVVEIKVFCPDERKEGGSYRQIQGKVVKIDEYRQKLWLETGISVQFHRIIQLFIR